MKYKCHDIFMIRNAALPLCIAGNLYNTHYMEVLDYINELGKYDFFKEALAVSTPALSEAIERLGKNERKDKAVYLSIYKYLIRAATRTTPYGLWANVSLAEFKETKGSVTKGDFTYKAISADNLWINKLIHKLESNAEVRQNLCLILNKSCYHRNGRLRNVNYTGHGVLEVPSKSNSSIRYTNLIKLIEKNTCEYIGYMDVANLIKAQYPEVNMKKIFETLDALIDAEYLFTELRIPAYCSDALKHVLNILKKHQLEYETQEKLVYLLELFEQYKTSVKGTNIIHEVVKIMSGIVKSSSYIEINSGNCLNESFLSNEIKNKIENFVNCLSLIGIERECFSQLSSFKNAFQEEYGNNVLVPLAQVIDPNGFDGLRYCGESEYVQTEREKQIRLVFEAKAQAAIMAKKRKVVFSKEDFRHIEEVDNAKYQRNFDLNFVITKNNDTTYLTLGPNVGASRAGKMFQRFENIFDSSNFEKYNEIYSYNDNTTLLVEMREPSSAGRMGNVVNWRQNYDYCFAVSMPYCGEKNGEITIDDLAIVLADNGELYVKSISQNKKCYFVTDNMLNPELNSKLLNLLQMITFSYEKIKVTERLSNLPYNHSIYMPEIQIEDITVSLEQWSLAEEMFKLSGKEDFRNQYKWICDTYAIPEYFYLCEYDNRLLLYRDSAATLEFLKQELSRKHKIHLSAIESEFLQNKAFLDSKGEGYNMEVVCSLYTKPVIKGTLENDEKYTLIDNKNRIVNPFEDGFLYLKIYCSKELENDLLVHFLSEKSMLGIEKFFFIRYIDNLGNHIRLRIKYSSEMEALEKYPLLLRWISDMKDNGYFMQWSIDEYHRENNRYGGSNIIEEIERFFFENSEDVISVLSKYDKQGEEEKKNTYFEFVGKFLYKLCGNKEEMFRIISAVAERGKYRDEYKTHRKKINIMLENILSEKKSPHAEKLSSLQDNYKTCNNMDDIKLSLLHMCCNRLDGRRNLEEYTYHLLRHSLYDIIQKEKKLKDKEKMNCQGLSLEGVTVKEKEESKP